MATTHPAESVDLHRPSTWRPYRTGLCDGCRALCCRLPVVVVADDLVRLELIPRADVMAPMRRLGRELTARGLIAEWTAWNRSFLLAKAASGACIYQDAAGRCSVYDRRPAACRDFPQVGPSPNHCPHQAKSGHTTNTIYRNPHQGCG